MEHIFLLAYYLGFTKEDSEKLPIQHRQWYIQRINTEIQKHSENSDDGSAYTKGAHDHQPESRNMRGQRPHAPARLRRFT